MWRSYSDCTLAFCSCSDLFGGLCPRKSDNNHGDRWWMSSWIAWMECNGWNGMEGWVWIPLILNHHDIMAVLWRLEMGVSSIVKDLCLACFANGPFLQTRPPPPLRLPSAAWWKESFDFYSIFDRHNRKQSNHVLFQYPSRPLQVSFQVEAIRQWSAAAYRGTELAERLSSRQRKALQEVPWFEIVILALTNQERQHALR